MDVTVSHYACFNPCYNGKGIIALGIYKYWTSEESFNPCYNGKGIIAIASRLLIRKAIMFQSLL